MSKKYGMSEIEDRYSKVLDKQIHDIAADKIPEILSKQLEEKDRQLQEKDKQISELLRITTDQQQQLLAMEQSKALPEPKKKWSLFNKN